MRTDRSFRTEGIILRRRDFAEADRLLTIFTREVGKIKAIAKGARKPQSRKTGHVELFMRSDLQLASGRELFIVSQAEVREPYRNLTLDLVRATYAAYSVELLDQFTPEQERNLTLYHLLSEALGWFDATSNFQLAARHYELRLLSLVGFQPQLFYCVVSGEPVENEDQYFSAELGGFIKPSQRYRDRRALRASAGAVKVMRFLQTRPWDAIQALQLRAELHAEVEKLMHYYLAYLLERDLKSAEFLYRLRHEAHLFSDKTPPKASNQQDLGPE